MAIDIFRGRMQCRRDLVKFFSAKTQWNKICTHTHPNSRNSRNHLHRLSPAHYDASKSFPPAYFYVTPLLLHYVVFASPNYWQKSNHFLWQLPKKKKKNWILLVGQFLLLFLLLLLLNGILMEFIRSTLKIRPFDKSIRRICIFSSSKTVKLFFCVLKLFFCLFLFEKKENIRFC